MLEWLLALLLDSFKLNFHVSFVQYKLNTFVNFIGKTMLMDIFYSATEGIVKHRSRFHFHEASACYGVLQYLDIILP